MQEHMIADFARALAESGTSVVIDGGDPLLVFAGQEEERENGINGLMVATKKIFHLKEALPQKHPGQRINIDGDDWTVLSHVISNASVCLKVERIIG